MRRRCAKRQRTSGGVRSYQNGNEFRTRFYRSENRGIHFSIMDRRASNGKKTDSCIYYIF